jgi:hypothetical protein
VLFKCLWLAGLGAWCQSTLALTYLYVIVYFVALWCSTLDALGARPFVCATRDVD